MTKAELGVRHRRRTTVLSAVPSFSVVESKLDAPPLRAGIVSRRALVDQLCTSSARFVTVLAPAGYGKTTLLNDQQPAAESPLPVPNQHDERRTPGRQQARDCGREVSRAEYEVGHVWRCLSAVQTQPPQGVNGDYRSQGHHGPGKPLVTRDCTPGRSQECRESAALRLLPPR
jgi:hypothetical protein